MTDRKLLSFNQYIETKSEDRNDEDIVVKGVVDDPTGVSDNLLKMLGIELTKEQRESSVVMTISNETVDRDGDILEVKGWKLQRFRKNPIVPWAHDTSQLPIGKAIKVWRDVPSKAPQKSRLRALKTFAVKEYDLAETVFNMIKGGFIKTASVGFIPYKWEPREKSPDEENRTYSPNGYVMREMELLESSIVPVPSNPDALIEARQVKGLNLDPMRSYLARALDGQVDIPIVGREDLESAWKSAGFSKDHFTVGSDVFDESTISSATSVADNKSNEVSTLVNLVSSIKDSQEIYIRKGSEDSGELLVVGVREKGSSGPDLSNTEDSDAEDNILTFSPELFG